MPKLKERDSVGVDEADCSAETLPGRDCRYPAWCTALTIPPSWAAFLGDFFGFRLRLDAPRRLRLGAGVWGGESLRLHRGQLSVVQCAL